MRKCQISNIKYQINTNPLLLDVRYSLRSTAGFSLIELLLVVAMLLTLSVGSSVFYSRFFLQSSVGNTVDRLVGSLRKAQIYSMSGKQNSMWSVNYSSNTITLYKGSVFATRDTTFDEKFAVGTNISVSGLTNVNFARLNGTPSAALSISVSGGGNNKSISVNNQGTVIR